MVFLTQLVYVYTDEKGDYDMDFISSITRSKSLGEIAYEALRDSIISLKLKPGQTIFENEIANTFGISRTPVRDAFQRLIAEGLIEVLPQRTKKITTISVSKVKESGFVRLSLEKSVFKLVSKNWSDTGQYVVAEKQVKRILEEQNEAAEQQNVSQFLELDEAFHKVILQLSGNDTLLDVVYQMRGHLNRFRFLAMKELVLTKGLVDEHAELFHEVKHGNVKKVDALLERHLNNFDSEIPQLRELFPRYFSD